MSGNTSEQSPQLEMHPGFDSQITVNNKHDGNNVRPCAASQRHIRTEQKRRDRINEGFVALQALLPGKEKVEKAIMLTQAADYIKQLQVCAKSYLRKKHLQDAAAHTDSLPRSACSLSIKHSSSVFGAEL